MKCKNETLRLCCQAVSSVSYNAPSHKHRRYYSYSRKQMADSQNEDEQAQLLGEEAVRAQPGQNLKLG